MPDWLEQAIGACLVLVVLLDVFLTVLYAHRHGIISDCRRKESSRPWRSRRSCEN